MSDFYKLTSAPSGVRRAKRILGSGVRENPEMRVDHVSQFMPGDDDITDIPYLIVSCCAHDVLMGWLYQPIPGSELLLKDDLIDPDFAEEAEADFMRVWSELGVKMAQRMDKGLAPAPHGVFAHVITGVDNDGRNQHVRGRGNTYMGASVGLDIQGESGRDWRWEMLTGCYGQAALWIWDQVASEELVRELYVRHYRVLRRIWRENDRPLAHMESPEEAAESLYHVVTRIADLMAENL